MQIQTNFLDSTPAVRLGQSHGYRIDHDTVAINADLAVANDVTGDQSQWALQLWACDAPYEGGQLSGFKVAEAAVDLYDASGFMPLRFDAQTAACLPGGQREYSMVLVLAAGRPGAFEVRDFANYPARERFAGPELTGSVGYAVDGDAVVIRAERVGNTRSDDNLSGSLSLELWAQPEHQAGGSIEGLRLAGIDLGRLAGQDSIVAIEQRVPFFVPEVGNWHLSLRLREWTAQAGYVTRDSCNFAAPYRREPEAAKVVEAPVAAKVVEAPVAAKVVEAPVAAKVVEAPVAAKAVEAPVAAKVVEAPVAAKVVEAPKAVVAKAEAPKPAVEAAKPAAAKTEAPKLVAVEAPKAVTATTAEAPKKSDWPERLSVSQATVDELAQVKGLSRKLAAEIVKARPFTSLDELVRVRGIGPRLLQSLRAHLKL